MTMTIGSLSTSEPLTHETASASGLRSRVAEIEPGKLFIDGAFRDAKSGKRRDNIDPSTGRVTTTVADGGAEDIDDAIAAARKAHDTGPWARMNPFDRGRLLRRVADIIRRRADEFALRETVDVGKPFTPTRGFDVPQGADLFEYYGGLAGQLDGRNLSGVGASTAYTRRESLGVVGAISPFNFPLNLSINKLAPALAAGNTVVHKPAAETPLSALLLAEVFAEAGFPGGVYNLVTGSGAVAGERLITGVGVDKIAFTGSTAVGIHTQTAAAATLKRVTLELGGKNALIVFADAVEGPSANLASLAETIFQAGFFNCGQFCMGCSRVLVERSVHDTLVNAVKERIARAFVGDPFDAATEIGPLAHKAQFDKVREYVDIARADGAEFVIGGKPLEVAATDGSGYFHELTMLSGVRPEMRVAREEIFGPVLSIIPFETEADALAIANGLPYGLSGGVATHDLTRAHRVAANIQAGIVWINTWSQFTTATSFGGYKQSGYGRELGLDGLDEYLQSKTVYVQMEG